MLLELDVLELHILDGVTIFFRCQSLDEDREECDDECHTRKHQDQRHSVVYEEGHPSHPFLARFQLSKECPPRGDRQTTVAQFLKKVKAPRQQEPFERYKKAVVVTTTAFFALYSVIMSVC